MPSTHQEGTQWSSESSKTSALQTDQRPGSDPEDIVVHLLGLAGEAGSVASEYKKMLRDGRSHAWFKPQMREELGDVLWYVAAIARHLDLDLDEIAQANIEKTRDRWLPSSSAALDSKWPEAERLPRRGTYEFVPTTAENGRPAVDLYLDGEKVGDQLTDASYVDDGYRFHDIFHLSYAVILGWSPVTRAILKRKRKSDPSHGRERGRRPRDRHRGRCRRPGVRLRHPAQHAGRHHPRGPEAAGHHPDGHRTTRGRSAQSSELGVSDPSGILRLPPARRTSGRPRSLRRRRAKPQFRGALTLHGSRAPRRQHGVSSDQLHPQHG